MQAAVSAEALKGAEPLEALSEFRDKITYSRGVFEEVKSEMVIMRKDITDILKIVGEIKRNQ